MLHGVKGSPLGAVMTTKVDVGNKTFLHASDIQLLDRATVDFIVSWQANIVLAAGPLTYLERLSDEQRAVAWENALILANNVETLILDHHLLRDQQGVKWLNALSTAAGKKIYCAADFMNKRRLLLESQKVQMYEAIPVPDGWHDEYAAGSIDLDPAFTPSIESHYE